MRFSIIVPVYNVARYLPACLESIDVQTFKDYEVILIDDGSTDDSGHICDAWAEDKNNVSVIHRKNKGLLMARREGYAKSNGEYIVSLDSDDMLHPAMLEKCAKAIDCCAPDIIAFSYSSKRDFSDSITHAIMSPGLNAGDSYNEAKALLCDGYFSNIWSKVFKTDIFDPGFSFDDYAGLMHGEDFLQVFPSFDAATSIYYIDQPLYFYRTNEQNSTSSYSSNKIGDLARVCDVVIYIAQKWGPEYVRRARAGMTRQFCGIATILFGDPSVLDKKDEFYKLAKTFRNCLGPDVDYKALHINQRQIVRAFLQDNYSVASRVCALTRSINKLRNI